MLLLNVILAVVLAISGTFMEVIARFVGGRFHRRHMVRSDRAAKITPEDRRKRFLANSAASTAMVFGVPNLAYGALFTEGPRPAWRLAVDAVAILVAYDFAYYLLHRFAFHRWSVGSRMHAVHHRVRTPYAKTASTCTPSRPSRGSAFSSCARSSWARSACGRSARRSSSTRC